MTKSEAEKYRDRINAFQNVLITDTANHEYMISELDKLARAGNPEKTDQPFQARSAVVRQVQIWRSETLASFMKDRDAIVAESGRR